MEEKNVYDRARGVVRELQPLLRAIREEDKSLADQLKRAAQSVVLDIAEARGVASDNRQDSNHRRLGASAEGRLAWPPASSPSGHLCKPTRPRDPRVALPRAPGRPLLNEKSHE